MALIEWVDATVGVEEKPAEENTKKEPKPKKETKREEPKAIEKEAARAGGSKFPEHYQLPARQDSRPSNP